MLLECIQGTKILYSHFSNIPFQYVLYSHVLLGRYLSNVSDELKNNKEWRISLWWLIVEIPIPCYIWEAARLFVFFQWLPFDIGNTLTNFMGSVIENPTLCCILKAILAIVGIFFHWLYSKWQMQISIFKILATKPICIIPDNDLYPRWLTTLLKCFNHSCHFMISGKGWHPR